MVFSRKSGIIKEKKLEIFKRIENEELPLKLNSGNQNKHLEASHSYKESEHKSILFGDLEAAQKMVDKYHGTGELRFNTKTNEWTKKEFITVDEDIGKVYDETSGEYLLTNRFAIHYGNKGTHIVPMRRRE